MPARFASDELYRKVFIREYIHDEPDWKTLDELYSGRVGFAVMEYKIIPVNPLNAIMFYVEKVIQELYVANVWPRGDKSDSEECFDEPSLCD